MNILIFGAGGHAKVVADIVEKQGQYKVLDFVDKNETAQKIKSHNCTAGVIGIGDNFLRSKVQEEILAINPKFQFVTAIHPSAVIAKNVTIGDGTVIMAQAQIGTETKIGSHCIINTKASLDHDCVLANFASLAPGVVTGGKVQIGEFSFLGLGAFVTHNIQIGKHSVIGAGSLVIKNISDFVVAYGSPCHVEKTRAPGDKYL